MMVNRNEERVPRMKLRRAWLLLLALAIVATATGCGEEEAVTAPTTADMEKDRAALLARKKAPKGKRAPKPKKAPAKAKGAKGSTEYAAGGQDYFYDPRGKRDPFRSYRFADDQETEQDFGPLGDFELGQLELSAVIWDATNPRALILDPGGRSYIVSEGSMIGKNNGQVIHIGDNLVLVKETYENFAGERTTKDVELRIRLSQGG